VKRKVIIGDIHGCYDELIELLNKIDTSFFDLIIAAGDIFDRGPKPAQVYNFFQQHQNTIVVMGNHDRKHALGLMPARSQKITQKVLGDLYPQVVSWLGSQRYYYESEEVIVVHAALEPGISMKKQKETILCGSMSGEKILKSKLRGKYWYEVYNDSKPVVFGHKVKNQDKKPFIYKNKVFGIDTGVCHGGYLSAITIPDFKIYSVKAHKNYWSEIKYILKIL